jgi:prevent-host-death family protein
MATTSVTRLKACLSEQLRRVQAGEELTVTDRGRPIARIVPFPAGISPNDDLAVLVERGLARLPLHELPRSFFDERTVADDEARLRAAVLEEREGER